MKKFFPTKKFLVAIILLSMSASWFYFSSRDIPFDSEKWKHARNTGDFQLCKRMVRSNSPSLEKALKNYESIIQNLGAPDVDVNGSHTTLFYYLGGEKKYIGFSNNKVKFYLKKNHDGSFTGEIIPD